MSAPMRGTDKGRIVTNCDEKKDVNASHKPAAGAGCLRAVVPASFSHLPMEEEERELVAPLHPDLGR